MPTWGAYAAVKTALAVFSEILHWELRKHDIHVTTVYPFMVNTGFYKDVTATAQTFGARMSMKLLPYYSYTPEKTARVIFNAVRRRKKTEMASVLNELSFYGQVVPFFADLMSWGSNLFLAKHD
jgi:short-subunit dehydrogenase